MSNQFYNYLKDKLVDFLKNKDLKGGERFYIQFDEVLQVEDFYCVLKNSDNVKDFTYKHNRGSLYNTFEININGISVIIAATIDSITSDFLVTLRNEVETQKNQWENKVVVFLFNENLDSIKDGSSNLSKEGMPFHVKTITKNLSKEINTSKLNKAEKKVVQFYLKQKLEDKIMQPTLWEFSEILSLISQENIKKEEYPLLGLFYDSNLLQYDFKGMSSRLEQNHDFYREIERIKEFGNAEENLEKIFDEKGINKLKGDKWKEQEFTFVKDSYENNKSDKVLEYIESVKKVTENDLIYWEKPFSTTKAGNRKRHIIIFNPLGVERIEINFNFDDFVKNEFLNKTSIKVCRASGKKLKAELPYEKGKATFKKITYVHNKKSNSKYEFNIVVIEVSPDMLIDIKTNMEISEGKKRIIVNNNNETINFGNGENCIVVNDLDENITIEMNSLEDTVKLPETISSNIEKEICLDLKVDENIVPLLIRNKLCNVSTISSKRVCKLKREHKENFVVDNNKVVQASGEFYPDNELKRIISYEKKWISKDFLYGQIKNDELEIIELDIDENLKKVYMNLVNYYKKNEFIPTLTYMNDTLKNLFQEFVSTFNNYIENICENNVMTQKEKNITKLATIIKDKNIILMPLHPLNIAYQLLIYNKINEEVLEPHISNRINGVNLLPYMYGENEKVLRAVSQNDISEWVIYEPINNVTTYDTNSFLAKIIEEKLNQFIKYFNYLFLEGSKAPLKVNSNQNTSLHFMFWNYPRARI